MCGWLREGLSEQPIVRGGKQKMKAWEQTQRDCERDGRQGGRENLLLVGGSRQAAETFSGKVCFCAMHVH